MTSRPATASVPPASNSTKNSPTSSRLPSGSPAQKAFSLLKYFPPTREISQANSPLIRRCLHIQHKPVKTIRRPQIRYPNGELWDLGEGWTALDYTIDKQGVPVAFHVIDGLGAPVYASIAMEGLSQARYEPAEAEGQKIDSRFHRIEIEFRVEGENRVGVHPNVTDAIDAAFKLRKEGKFDASLARLQDAINGKLNLYELTTISFGMAMSYRGQGNPRMALLHVRHAAIDNARMADRGLTKSILEIAAELEALDGNPVDALCALGERRRLDQDYQSTADLAALDARARKQISGDERLTTDVILQETGRTDVEPNWYHPVLRTNLTMRKIRGTVGRIRLICSTTQIERNITEGDVLTFEEGVQPCLLYVYGTAGSSFTLEEFNTSPQTAPAHGQ